MADRRRRRRREDEVEDEEEDSEKTVNPNTKTPQPRSSECLSEDETSETGGTSGQKDGNKELKSKDAGEAEEEEEESEEDSEEETDDEDDEDDDEEEEEYDDVDVIIEDDGSFVDEERQSGDGEEQKDQQKELDDDEDRKNPAFIPRKGAFYEHDTRMGAQEKEMEDPQIKKKLWKENDRWIHDRFQQDEQAPKSREELIALYGYDIRACDKPPDRAPGLRGRGRRGRRPYGKSELGDFVERQSRNYDYSNKNQNAEIIETDYRPTQKYRSYDNKTAGYRPQYNTSQDGDSNGSQKTLDNKTFDVRSQFDRFQQQRNIVDKAIRTSHQDVRSQDARNQSQGDNQSESRDSGYENHNRQNRNPRNQTENQDYRNESNRRASFRNQYDGPKESRNQYDGPKESRNQNDGPKESRNQYDGPKESRNQYDGPKESRNQNDVSKESRNQYDVSKESRNQYDGSKESRNQYDSSKESRIQYDSPKESRNQLEREEFQAGNHQLEYNERRNVDNYRGRGRGMRRGRGNPRNEIAPRYSRMQNSPQSYTGAAPQREFFNSSYQSVDGDSKGLPDNTEVRETSESQDVVISNKDQTISVKITNTTTEKKSYAKERHGKYVGVTHAQDTVNVVDVGRGEMGIPDMKEKMVTDDVRKMQGAPAALVERKGASPVISKSDTGQQMRPKRYSSQRQRTAPDASYAENIAVESSPNYYNPAYPAPVYHPERVPPPQAPAPVFQHPDRPPAPAPVFQHSDRPPAPAPVFQHPDRPPAPAPVFQHAPDSRVPPSPTAVFQHPQDRVPAAPPVYHQERVPVSAQEGAFQATILQPPMAFSLPVSTAGLSSPPRIYPPSVAAPSVSIAAPTRLIPPQYIAAGMVYGAPPPPPGSFQMPVAFPSPPTGPPPPAPAPVQTAAVQLVAHDWCNNGDVGPPPSGPPGNAGPEVYRGGTTYYAPELQLHRASHHRSPPRRAKLAIPIVKPEDRSRGSSKSQDSDEVGRIDADSQDLEEGGQQEWNVYGDEILHGADSTSQLQYVEAEEEQQEWTSDGLHNTSSDSFTDSVPISTDVHDTPDNTSADTVLHNMADVSVSSLDDPTDANFSCGGDRLVNVSESNAVSGASRDIVDSGGSVIHPSRVEDVTINESNATESKASKSDVVSHILHVEKTEDTREVEVAKRLEDAREVEVASRLEDAREVEVASRLEDTKEEVEVTSRLEDAREEVEVASRLEDTREEVEVASRLEDTREEVEVASRLEDTREEVEVASRLEDAREVEVASRLEDTREEVEVASRLEDTREEVEVASRLEDTGEAVEISRLNEKANSTETTCRPDNKNEMNMANTGLPDVLSVTLETVKQEQQEMINSCEENSSDNQGEVINGDTREVTSANRAELNSRMCDATKEEHNYRAPVVHEFVVKRQLQVEDSKPSIHELGICEPLESQTAPSFAVDKQVSVKSEPLSTQNIKTESLPSQ